MVRLIRRATARDAAVLVELGRAMAGESPTAYPPVEFEPSQRWLVNADMNPERMYAALAEPDIGFITGAIGPWSFSDRLRGACDLLFVRPEHRGGSAAVRLWRSFADWATANGAETLIAGSTTGVASERTARLFEAMGLPRVGSLHMAAV